MTKILVIEDAEPLRNDIIEMLTFEGFDVIGAENGAVGVEVARTNQPDLIICDIMMPKLDGYGVLDALRRDVKTMSIPFIFLTAKTDRTDVRLGMGLGADDYLTKPFVASELLATISARMEKQSTFINMAERKLKELSDSIITALPHELRTPLNTIVGFSDMLMSESERLSPEQVTEWALHINLAAQRLYRLVENYLMYVRTEVATHNRSEVAALKDKFVDHPDTVVEFHAVYKAQQAKRESDLNVDLVGNVRVNISDHDLGKVIEELVDNAVKFSSHGTPIRIEGKVTDQRYILQVIDEGRGMTNEQVESIGAYMQFERWFYEQQGSGLGLIIVKRLIELYGGELKIKSQLDSGTCVSVILPILPTS